ncbi:MAG TPA: DUF6263 family protein, partial [Pirellulales bacterium]|nr:DUF6263 family protein [Pirellulales bacterium]
KTRETQKITQTLSLNGQNLDTKADVIMTTQTAFGQRDAEGGLTYKTTFVSILADMELYGSKVKFDSANPDVKSDSPIADIVLDAFRKLKDSTLTVKLDKDGQVVSVEGIQEGTGLAPDSIKNANAQRLNRLPAEAVKPGDTWERDEEADLGQGQILAVKRKYEYVGTTPKFPTVKNSPQLDKITATDLSVEYKVKGDANPITVKESDLKVGNSKHTFLFDRDAGRFVDEQSELQVKGVLKLLVMGMELDLVDLKIETGRREIE